jgi:hypothetical protein
MKKLALRLTVGFLFASACAPGQIAVGAGSGAPYVFQYFITPTGSDSNDGLATTVGGGHGPWSLNAINTKRSTYAGHNVCLVGDQGVLTLRGATPPVKYSTGTYFSPALNIATGTAANPTVIASCDTAGNYVRGLAVVDGGVTGTDWTAGSCTSCGANPLLGSGYGAGTGYVTIDGLEVRNAWGVAIIMGDNRTQSGFVVRNNLVHHVFSPDEGFKARASASGTTMTVTAVSAGTVNVGDVVYGGSGVGGNITAQTSGTTGGAGTYTLSGSFTWDLQNVTGSAFAGGNLAGIKLYAANGALIYNNFVYAVQDKNTALPNNIRSQGIQTWGTHDSLIDLNTVYADPTTGQPTVGIEIKNTGQYNLTVTRNYVNLLNAVAGGVMDVAVAADITGCSGVYSTWTNNLLVTKSGGGIPPVGGSVEQCSTITIANNTMRNTRSGGGGMMRFSQEGTPTVTHYNNIYVRAGMPGWRGDVNWNVDGMNLTDYNLYPDRFGIGLTTSKSTAGPTLCGGTFCTSFAAVAAAILSTTEGKEAHSLSGAVKFANGSGTMLKASDYQLASSSLGHLRGTTNGLASGDPTDMGAWGNGVTAVGCQWLDPFSSAGDGASAGGDGSGPAAPKLIGVH